MEKFNITHRLKYNIIFLQLTIEMNRNYLNIQTKCVVLYTNLKIVQSCFTEKGKFHQSTKYFKQPHARKT